MRHFKFFLLLVAAASVLFTSCNPISNTKYIQKNKVIILNQGNYLSQDGSVYIYDEDTKDMTVRAYARANNNTSIGATVMSGTYSRYGFGYLLCSNPDKIEIVDILTMKTLSNPIEKNLSNTREILLGGEYIFVTNAGDKFTEDEYGIREYTDSYVSIYFQNNNALKDTIHVGSDAQGMICVDSYLYVGTRDGIVKIQYDGSDFKKVGIYQDEEYTGAVKYLCYSNNLIYASVPGYGVYAYDPIDGRTREHYDMADELDSNAYITLFEKDIYTFSTTYEPDYTVASSNVYKLNLDSGEITNIYDGEYVYGVGVSPATKNMFISEANGFTTNSMINIVNTQTESVINTPTAGVGAFRFLFVSYYEEDKSEEQK